MDNMPLISVIVPVYKVEAYLDQCIRSITEQTYRNLEILLVDDGSPDNSGAICDTWAARDSRVKVIHKENGGAGAARNTALDQAAGSMIAFVDSDDYIAPGMYQHLYELLQEEADIAECGYLETAEDRVSFPSEDQRKQCYTPQDAMREHVRDTIFRQIIWNKLYSREVIADIRFPVGTKIDDEFFTYRVLGNAKKLIRSERVCYAYRQQPDSVMHQPFSLKQVEALRAKQLRLAYLKHHMPSLENEAKTELLLTCIYTMQGSLRWLKDHELESARHLIQNAMADAIPLTLDSELSQKKKILLKLAQKNLEGTAKLLNFLTDIHVLT